MPKGGGQVEIVAHLVYELDPDGKQLRVVKFTDYAAEKVRSIYRNAAELRREWANPQQRREIIVMDTFTRCIAGTACGTVLDLEAADVHKRNIRPGLSCSLEDCHYQPSCLALLPFRAPVDADYLHDFVLHVRMIANR